MQALREHLRARLGPGGVLDAAADLQRYANDEVPGHPGGLPGLVTLPRSAEDVAAIVRACVAYGVPFVARGAGTGLSGGARPEPGAVVVACERMTRILDIDVANQRMLVEPGVTNLAISEAVAGHGLYFAPDPSSQALCTIGGNVAENAGGAHCLKYGFTTHHVLAMEVVLPDGTLTWLGDSVPDAPGLDLRGLFVGAEGTLGIATKVLVRLLRRPEAVRTLLADFPSPAAAGDAVSALVAASVTPAAVELMDALTITACTKAGYGDDLSPDAGAALLIELDGPAAEVDATFVTTQRICEQHGALRLTSADEPAERERLWHARRQAFNAMYSLRPAYYVQDGVIPRTRLGEVLQRIAALAEDAGLPVANVFHAGDGNLHPLILFDPADPGETERAKQLAEAIVRCCVDAGGSITGEHGVGADKVCAMPSMFSDDDLAVMARVRAALDPDGLANPGKLLPTPRLCGDRPGPHRPHPGERSGDIQPW
ncbi:MAG: FAD-linked oxidase C-terminal domain-containing protein [Acidimicrobiia bacterium]